MPARTALLLSLATQWACVAGICPPARTEVGTTVIAAGGQPQNGVRFATGAHLASGQTARDRNYDIGAGVVYERLAAPVTGSEERALGAMSPPASEAPEHIDAHGGYLDLAGVMHRGAHHRTWLGARSEVMRQPGRDGSRAIGATFARVAWEAYAPVKAAGAGGNGGTLGAGFAYGAFALGVFLESGVRYAEGEEPAFVAIGGMTLRTPWMGGFALDLTPKW